MSYENRCDVTVNNSLSYVDLNDLYTVHIYRAGVIATLSVETLYIIFKKVFSKLWNYSNWVSK